MMYRALKHKNSQGGFSLIEVLIALVILSVGLLGIAAMVSVSVKAKGSSYLRTQAIALSGAILDRMRANAATAIAGNYNIVVAKGTVTSGSLSQQNCNDATCTPAQIAAMDLYDWDQDLVNLLGGGDPTNVSFSVTTSTVAQFTQVQVAISWTDVANQALGVSTNGGASTADSNCDTASPNPASIASATGYSTCYNAVVITSGLRD